MTSEVRDNNKNGSNNNITQADPLPIFSMGDATEVVNQVATHLTTGLHASSILQMQAAESSLVVNRVATHRTTGLHGSSISQMQADPLPVFSMGDIREVVNQVAAHLTAGLQASSIWQTQGGGGDDGGHASIDMPPHQQVPATLPPPAPVKLISAIWTTSLLTMVSAISTALYKPARGVVFGHNKLAYYSVLSAILASGFGEATTAFLLSRPGGASRRNLTFGRVVLCASVFPLVVVLGIAGYGFKEG